MQPRSPGKQCQRTSGSRGRRQGSASANAAVPVEPANWHDTVQAHWHDTVQPVRRPATSPSRLPRPPAAHLDSAHQRTASARARTVNGPSSASRSAPVAARCRTSSSPAATTCIAWERDVRAQRLVHYREGVRSQLVLGGRGGQQHVITPGRSPQRRRSAAGMTRYGLTGIVTIPPGHGAR
jgi:hypothetical protein